MTEKESMKKSEIASLVISIIALLASTLASVYSMQQTKNSYKASLRDQLNIVTKDIFDTFASNNELSLLPDSLRNNSFYVRQSLLASKMQNLVRQALWIENKIPDQVSDVEYTLLANSLWAVYETDKAREFYKKAIGLSESKYARIANLREYAGFLYSIGESSEGAKQYEAALGPESTDNDKANNGYTYQKWFVSVARQGDFAQAKTLYDKAKFLYSSVSNKYLSDYYLKNLDNSRMQFPGMRQ